ncbi:hypothetical protein vseg_000650 [Gypsophila vaccaria]
MNNKDKLKLNLDDKVFIRLDNDNDDDDLPNTEFDLLTSFQNSFKTLKSEPIIDIDDDDDNTNTDTNTNTNTATSSNMKREINLNPNPGPLAQLFTCDMCTNTKPKYKSMNIKGCTHFFCCECIETHVGSNLRDGATHVHCPVPHCSGTLDPEYCKDFVSNEIYNQWGQQLCESAIVDGQKYYCPFTDCSIMLVNDSAEEVVMAECPYCHRMFCAVCRVVWHHGASCEEHQKTLLGGY